MEVNSNNNSCANVLGRDLQKPLFNLFSNIGPTDQDVEYEDTAWVIAKVAFHCLVALLFIIPAGLAWLVGKSITLITNTKIQEVKISEQEEYDPSFNIMPLVDKYARLYSASHNLRYYCERANKPLTYFNMGSKDHQTYAEIHFHIVYILKKIDSDQVPEDKKRDIWDKLNNGSWACPFFFHSAIIKLYDELQAQDSPKVSDNPVKGKLKNLLQGFPLLLLKQEHIEKIIPIVVKLINAKDYDASFFDFLVEKVKELKLAKDPDTYVIENYYKEDEDEENEGKMLLLPNGARLLLEQTGILK